uniref:MMS19 nucleotide excision repair protein n=1 Tax=Romanomermis culicivorax TaxID=13658 RepID=A0A915ITK1_ROMCU
MRPPYQESALERFKADQIDYYEEKLAFCLRSVISKTKSVSLINNDMIYKCIGRLVKDSYENYAAEQGVKTILESTNSKSLHLFLEASPYALDIDLNSCDQDLNTRVSIIQQVAFMLELYCLEELYSEYKISLDPFVKNRLLNETEIDLLPNWLLCASFILQLDPKVFSDQELIIIVHKFADFSNDSASEEFRCSVMKFLQSVGRQNFNFVRKVAENAFSDSKMLQMCPMFVVNDDTAALCLPSILSARFDFVKSDDELSFQLNLIQNLKRCLEQQRSEKFKIDVLRKIFHHVLKIYIFIVDSPDQRDTKIIVRLADLAQDLMIEASFFSGCSSESQFVDLILLEANNRPSNIRYGVLLDRILAAISLNLTNRFIDTIDRILIAMNIYLESKNREIDTDVQYYAYYGRCIASAVCKLEKNHPILNRIIENYYCKLKARLNDLDPTVIRCFGFLCKSFLMRNLTPFAESSLQQMLEFTALTGSSEALKLVDNLFHEDKCFLNSNLHCICAPLYIQRVFTYCTTFIATSLEKSTDEPSDAQTSNCRILSLVLSNAPFNKQTFGQIGKVISILVHSLKPTHDSSILNPILVALGRLLSAKEEVLLDQLIGYLPNLVESLSELSTKPSDMNLRIASLKCLSTISVTIPPKILNGHKYFVLKALTKCLDDPKRLVRKEAAICKNKWCLL